MSRQRNLSTAIWQAFDSLRDGLDLSRSRDYFLSLLFLKFVSDTSDAKRAAYEKKYEGDTRLIERAMRLEPFRAPDESHFRNVLALRDSPRLGHALNKACEAIQDANGQPLPYLSGKVDFESAELGDPNIRVRRLSQMITAIGTLELSGDSADTAGDTYEELLRLFATNDRKTAAEWHTPREITRLIAEIVSPKPGERIYDPSCGTGGFLLQAAQVAQQLHSQDFGLFGQEKNASAWAIGRMNLEMHGLDSSLVERTNSINEPLTDGGELLRFDTVISKPPFSLENWNPDAVEYSRSGRFRWGMPPKHRGDYAYISHAVESLKPKGGRAAIIVPLGALFRGGSEGVIRRRLIEEKLLEGVIALPPNLFVGTSIPVAILLFRTGRTDDSIFFIDASREFASEKNQHRLRPEHTQRILNTWNAREEAPGYSRLVPRTDIESNEFNLNVSLYIADSVTSDLVDLIEGRQRVDEIEERLASVRRLLADALRKLGE